MAAVSGHGEASPNTFAPAAASPPLVADAIAKSYDDGETEIPVIADLSFTLKAGEIVSIVGPSGCGKTTLLNVLCGLTPPSAGAVSWYGRTLSGMPPRVGYMLQKDLLLPWRTALANVTLGLELRGPVRMEERDKARVLLDQLGLHGFADRYPSTFSGGMRQRVALARTFVGDPDVLLLDEPFGALDFQTKLLIESDTVRLVRGKGRAMLCITHDIEEAVSLSDRVIVLSRRPTRVKTVYDIVLDGDRTDMMAARQAKGFSDYVRAIWRDLDVVRQ